MSKNVFSPDSFRMAGESPIVDVDRQYNNPNTFDRSAIPFDVKLETFEKLKARTETEDEYIYSRLKYKNEINLVSVKSIYLLFCYFILVFSVH